MTESTMASLKTTPTAHLRFADGQLQQWFVQQGYEWVGPVIMWAGQDATLRNQVGEWRNVPSAPTSTGNDND